MSQRRRQPKHQRDGQGLSEHQQCEHEAHRVDKGDATLAIHEPRLLGQSFPQLDLMVHCAAHTCWASVASNAWLACLFLGNRVVAQHIRYGPNWYLILDFASGSTMLGWPIRKIQVGKTSVWKLFSRPSMDSVRHLVVESLEGWNTFHVRWVSPAHLAACNPKDVQPASQLGLCMVQLSEPSTPLKTAARHAFFTMPRTVLLRTANKFGVIPDDMDSIVSVLHALIVKALGPLPDHEILAILRTRLVDACMDDLQSFVEDDVVMNEILQQDQKEAESLHKSLSEDANQADTFRSQYIALRAKLKAKATAAAKAMPAAKARALLSHHDPPQVKKISSESAHSY